MVNPRPLGRIKGLALWTVPVDAYGGYGAQSESEAPFSDFSGFGSSGGVSDRKVRLVDRNGNHLCALEVRKGRAALPHGFKAGPTEM